MDIYDTILLVIALITFGTGFYLGFSFKMLNEAVRESKIRRITELFDKGLDTDDYNLSKPAYDSLINILPENDIRRKMFTIQMSQFDCKDLNQDQ